MLFLERLVERTFHVAFNFKVAIPVIGYPTRHVAKSVSECSKCDYTCYTIIGHDFLIVNIVFFTMLPITTILKSEEDVICLTLLITLYLSSSPYKCIYFLYFLFLFTILII